MKHNAVIITHLILVSLNFRCGRGMLVFCYSNLLSCIGTILNPHRYDFIYIYMNCLTSGHSLLLYTREAFIFLNDNQSKDRKRHITQSKRPHSILNRFKCAKLCVSLIFVHYSSTCHERTASGPCKSVRTLQVAAHQRDGRADADAKYNTPCKTTYLYYYRHQRYSY